MSTRLLISIYINAKFIVICKTPDFNYRLPKGGGHQNAKQSDPGHLSNLFYILCGYFDETNPGVPPKIVVG